MNLGRRWLVGLAFVCCWWSVCVFAADKPVTMTVQVQGEAAIYENNVPAARQRALQEACSAAITQILGTFISAESYTRNFESIERGVYSKTQGYVKNYQVLNETVSEGILALTAQVTVSAEAVQDDLTALGIILDALGNPVLTVEGMDEGLTKPQSVRVFREKLVEKGFQVLDQNDASAAEVIVRLEGRIQNVSDLNIMHGAIGSLNASAYWKDSGRLILSDSSKSNGAGVTQEAALNAAYMKAADILFPRFLQTVLAKWQDEINNGRSLEIALVSADYRQVQVFQQRLSRIFGIKKIVLKNFKQGRAIFLVKFSGTTDLLAQLIHRTDFLRLNPKIVDVNAERITLVLASIKTTP